MTEKRQDPSLQSYKQSKKSQEHHLPPKPHCRKQDLGYRVPQHPSLSDGEAGGTPMCEWCFGTLCLRGYSISITKCYQEQVFDKHLPAWGQMEGFKVCLSCGPRTLCYVCFLKSQLRCIASLPGRIILISGLNYSDVKLLKIKTTIWISTTVFLILESSLLYFTAVGIFARLCYWASFMTFIFMCNCLALVKSKINLLISQN